MKKPSKKRSQLFGKCNEDLHSREIQAIYRIPGRPNSDRHVQLKVQNINSNSKLMRVQAAVKSAGHKLVNDVTKLNSKLISDLLTNRSIEELGISMTLFLGGRLLAEDSNFTPMMI